jgi:predicted transcriptional regulator of viral defense system
MKDKYIRTKDLIKSGYHPRKIKEMADRNEIIKIKKGLYRKVTDNEPENQGFIDLAVAVPIGVICLLSAVSYHELSTFNPSSISIAIPHGARMQKIYYPPTKMYLFSPDMYKTGIEEIKNGGYSFKIYSKEKTICDCFRYRNKVGIDVAKESIREYLRLKNRDIVKLLKTAEICRVKHLIDPWLNALV